MAFAGELAQVIWTAFDVETTGLTPLVDRLIEVGAVRFQGEQVLDTYSALINPGRPIPFDATSVHGITDAMVQQEGRAAEQVLPEFRQMLGPPTMVLVAHNAPFDLEFLATDFARLGIRYPEQPVCDTLPLARTLLPQLAHFDLGSVAHALGVGAEEAHRGLADAMTVMRVLGGLLQRRGKPTTRLADLTRLAGAVKFEDCAVRQIGAPPGMELLEQAARVGWEVEIVYEGGTQGSGWRRITPIALLERRGAGYLAAFCHREHRDKFYRLDRIRAVREGQ
jgi:DNA polymerase III epsilon subunit family exonuclease